MDRVEKIKRKFGKDAFVRFGAKGGSPILLAYKEGRITIHNTRKHKK